MGCFVPLANGDEATPSVLKQILGRKGLLFLAHLAQARFGVEVRRGLLLVDAHLPEQVVQDPGPSWLLAAARIRALFPRQLLRAVAVEAGGREAPRRDACGTHPCKLVAYNGGVAVVPVEHHAVAVDPFEQRVRDNEALGPFQRHRA